jgi:ribose transport system substrate-binding protein
MRIPAGQRFRALATATTLLVAVVTGGGLTAAQDSTPATGPQSEFFVQEEFEEQLRLRDVEPEGPADQPWAQALEPEYVDTSQYATDPPYKVCFSNAGVNNPWRVVGWTTMQAEVDLQPDIAEFVHVDAEGSDEKQIADIQDLLGQDCTILIVSPNTTAALTPAVE